VVVAGADRSDREKSPVNAMPRKPRSSRSAAKDGDGSVQAAEVLGEESDRHVTTASSAADAAPHQAFPIACLGASAGGLEAFVQILQKMRPDSGVAFVVVQHLDPTHDSLLTQILARESSLPVVEVSEGCAVKPGTIYVQPPNSLMRIEAGALHLQPRLESRAPQMPIDYFLRSLAAERGALAIAVILSGTGTDGALGLRAIKGEGGLTFAQEARSARYDGMPRTAISTGYVDAVFTPEGIASELARFGKDPLFAKARVASPDPVTLDPQEMKKLFGMLRRATDVDFTHYKHTTIQRRLLRRMALHRCGDLASYLAYVQEHPGEVQALYQDLLIRVTSFFRDPDSFRALKVLVFPSIAKSRAAGDPLRIWIPGCATGEEVYSIAISLLEYLDTGGKGCAFQIFATDVSDVAIDRARAGLFMDNIAADVSPERLRRFFTKVDGGYQIVKSIRDCCVFARQNVAKDPPFSRVDLISCRNLLIYLEPVLQKRLMSLFHYALKSTGFLTLGGAETIGASSDLFSLVDRTHKIYAKKLATIRPSLEFAAAMGPEREEPTTARAARPIEDWTTQDLQREADRVVMARYAPAGVVVNDTMDILQFRGHTGPFLEPSPGDASLNLFRMARHGLLFDLRTVLHKAKKSGQPVRKEGALVKDGSSVRQVAIEVTPLHEEPAAKDRCYLVLFELLEPPAPEAPRKKGTKPAKVTEKPDGRQLALLQQEISATKDYLQSIIEEQEATNEELKSANEEVLSSNEELQSINEQLETAKEELQSTNEELTTVNEELHTRNAELGLANNDLSNLLNSVNIPIVMLGSDLRIRRFTPQVDRVLHVISTDIGRPIGDIKPNIDTTQLDSLVGQVVDTMQPIEREVRDRDGRWYSMRIRPYKTLENKIDGAVIAWIDIDALKRAK
jgi:two-component system, chemotaxis family, CheB/CheR fusion protein